jgi:probable HAF family extracellular repeat protein
MKAARLILTTVAFIALLLGPATASRSITFVVGQWQVTLTDLGVLPGGFTASSALAINNPGEIAGLGAAEGSFDLLRPIWDANTGAILRFADNLDSAGTSIPEAINDLGEMVGTVTFGGRIWYGVYWNPQGRAFRLPPLPGGELLFSDIKGHGINNLGQMVGSSQQGPSDFSTHAVLWQNKDTPALDLGFLGPGAYVNYSDAFAINDLAHVVGESALGSLIRGFLWRSGRMIDLGGLPSQISSQAFAINNTGLIAGKSGYIPVVWIYDESNPTSTPVIQPLPIPEGFFSAQPTDVNNRDDVAGYAGSPSIDAHAVLWRNGQAIDLGVWPGGHYSMANGINDAGQIVGTGTVAADNLDHALMWTVVPLSGGDANATPVAKLQATSPTSIRVGQSVSVQASFTDPDYGPWSYHLAWGDGTASVGTISTTGRITAISTHVYTRAGRFKARLTVTDRRGASGASKAVTVRVR